MLPHVVEFNLIGSRSRYADIATMMCDDIETADIRERSMITVDLIRELLDDVQVSCRLRDYQITKEDIPELVEGALKQARLFGRNPRNLDRRDIEEIFAKAW